ncbi:MAG: type III-B CRISPR-associated protein Cas10/Cmr2, partial [Candidatus Baltobacteraceae bacterium]
MSRISFSISPVQSFVIQSRRTRDLWASSWLLSWLSGQAMFAALQNGKPGRELVIPKVSGDNLPKLAGREFPVLPNRFILIVNDLDDARKAAVAAENAFQKAWKSIAMEVWAHFIESAASKNPDQVAQIWSRQIDSFWEFSWVAHEEDDTSALDRRKNWRLPPVTVESGDRCTLMPPWQEISGFSSARPEGRKAQHEFWQTVKREVRDPQSIDDRERLCAVAVVKRLFPMLKGESLKKAFGNDVSGWTSAWPSTVDFATYPWRKRIEKACEADTRLDSLIENFLRVAGYEGQRLTEPKIGRLVLEESIDRLDDRDSGYKDRVKVALGEIERHFGKPAGGHFAVLKADGDHVGKALRSAAEAGKEEKFSRSLVEFAEAVPDIVKKYAGRCVYSGGDDVLALMPTDDALLCASEIAKTFSDKFSRLQISRPPTLSVAVLFANYLHPLRQALHGAERLLNDVAKGESGRDSLAIGLQKHSGYSAQLAGKWDWWDTRIDIFKKMLDGNLTGEPTITRSYLHHVLEV